MHQPTHSHPKVSSTAAVLGALLLSLPLINAQAGDVSVGAGMRTSFTHDDPDGGAKTDDYSLDSIRLYVNGTATDNIKFTFNTEYNGNNSDQLILMDAIARFEFSDQFNIWAGRFLPPVDRANLYGPYYANNFKPYVDGVADNYPSFAVGRDNGVAYWGQFGIVKVSAGVFDVPATFGSNKVLTAERVMVDLLDPEPGYYLNGTYYGKDILAIGVASQQLLGKTIYSGDVMFEKKLSAGVLNLEGEYMNNDVEKSDGYYALASLLLPQKVGIGQFQPLLKFGTKNFDAGGDVKTTEFDLNYVIKGFNARVSLFYLDQKADPSGLSDKSYGLGLQLQM